MSTLITLLGGVLLLVVLHALLGAMPKLPPALRAILASSLSLVAYFGLTLGRWPGLDVVAMHISVFLVAGLLLYMFSQYRSRRTGRLHWVPKLLIAFFVLLAVINTFLLYIATRGLPPALAQFWLPGGSTVNTGFSGVVQHGQEAAKAVSSELNRSYSAAQLGWRIHLNGMPASVQAPPLISVRVLDRSGSPVADLQAEMQLSRPGSAQIESRIPLPAKSPGEYGNVLVFPGGGRWLLDLQLRQKGQLVYRESDEITVQ